MLGTVAHRIVNDKIPGIKLYQLSLPVISSKRPFPFISVLKFSSQSYITICSTLQSSSEKHPTVESLSCSFFLLPLDFTYCSKFQIL